MGKVSLEQMVGELKDSYFRTTGQWPRYVTLHPLRVTTHVAKIHDLIVIRDLDCPFDQIYVTVGKISSKKSSH